MWVVGFFVTCGGRRGSPGGGSSAAAEGCRSRLVCHLGWGPRVVARELWAAGCRAWVVGREAWAEGRGPVSSRGRGGGESVVGRGWRVVGGGKRGEGRGPSALSVSRIHISEPTRPYESSYAVFCSKKKIVPEN